MRKIYLASIFLLLVVFISSPMQYCVKKTNVVTYKKPVKHEICYKERQRMHRLVRREAKTEEEQGHKFLQNDEENRKFGHIHRLVYDLFEENIENPCFIRKKIRNVIIVKFRPQSARMYIKKEEPEQKQLTQSNARSIINVGDFVKETVLKGISYERKRILQRTDH